MYWFVKVTDNAENNFSSYNMNKFLSGETNILLITGYSGSGKSTLAEKYSHKYDVVHIGLDYVDPTKDSSWIDKNKEDFELQVFYDFFEDYDDIKHMVERNEKHNRDYVMETFIPYAISWCLKHKTYEFSIEGTQIYEYPQLIDKTLPIIVMNTSAEESAKRKFERDDYFDKQIVSEKNIKKLERFKKELRK